MGDQWKIWFLGRKSRKKQYTGGLSKKGAWTVYRFKELGKEKGVVFLMGGWYPNAYYALNLSHISYIDETWQLYHT